MPTSYPKEFRRDVIAVARKGDHSMAQVARSFGISESRLDELRLAIVVWIESTYHRRRRQDGLGRLTPIEFETLVQTAHAA